MEIYQFIQQSKEMAELTRATEEQTDDKYSSSNNVETSEGLPPLTFHKPKRPQPIYTTEWFGKLSIEERIKTMIEYHEQLLRERHKSLIKNYKISAVKWPSPELLTKKYSTIKLTAREFEVEGAEEKEEEEKNRSETQLFDWQDDLKENSQGMVVELFRMLSMGI